MRMSPVSRGRKGKKSKKPTRRTGRTDAVFGMPDACDCPSCARGDFDPQPLIEELTSRAVALIGSEDPLEIEMMGATFLSACATGEGFEEALVSGVIPTFEARGAADGLVLLLAIASVADGRVGKEASA